MRLPFQREPTAVLDLRCIPWVLHTSDKDIRLLTLEYLTKIAVLADFNPTLVADRFTVFIGCVKIVNTDAVVTQGLERLAKVSAIAVPRTFAHPSTVDLISRIFADIHQCYIGVFPPKIRFNSLPFPHTFCGLHSLFGRHQKYRWIQQRVSEPSCQKRVMVTLSHRAGPIQLLEERRSKGTTLNPRFRDAFPDPKSPAPDLNHRGLPINRCDRPEFECRSYDLGPGVCSYLLAFQMLILLTRN